MNQPKLIALLALAASVLSTPAFAQYHEVAKFHIGGDASRVDYVRSDPVNRRLYIAHDKRFEVLDLDTGKKVGEIGPAARAHGVAVVNEFNHGFASSGGTSTIIMFDLKTLQTIKTIKSTGKNPDGIEYDPETKKVYIANGGSGNMTIMDPADGSIVNTVQLVDPKDAKLEAMAFGGKGICYVNDEMKTCMHTFNTHTLKVGGTFSLEPGEGGTGLAMDTETHRLFATCSNSKLIVVDADTGKVVATPPIGEDPDAAYFDAATKLIYVSNSDSTLTILHEDTPDTYSVVQSVTTGKGAKTSWVCEGKVYLPVMKFGPAPAPTKAKPEPRPPVIPGSLDILVLGK